MTQPVDPTKAPVQQTQRAGGAQAAGDHESRGEFADLFASWLQPAQLGSLVSVNPATVTTFPEACEARAQRLREKPHPAHEDAEVNEKSAERNSQSITHATAVQLPDPLAAAKALLRSADQSSPTNFDHPQSPPDKQSISGAAHEDASERNEQSRRSSRDAGSADNRAPNHARVPRETTGDSPTSGSAVASPDLQGAAGTGQGSLAEPVQASGSQGGDGNYDAASPAASRVNGATPAVRNESPPGVASPIAASQPRSDQVVKSLLASPSSSPAGMNRGQAIGGGAHAAQRKGGPLVAQSEDPLAAQLGRGLAAALRQKGGSVLIRLAPDALGQLRVHLTLEKSQVSARIETSNAEAHDLLLKSESALRASLEARGLEVKHVEIVNIGKPETQPSHDRREDAHRDGEAQNASGDAPNDGTLQQQSRNDRERSRGGLVNEAAAAPQSASVGPWDPQSDAWASVDSLRVDMTA